MALLDQERERELEEPQRDFVVSLQLDDPQEEVVLALYSSWVLGLVLALHSSWVLLVLVLALVH